MGVSLDGEEGHASTSLDRSRACRWVSTCFLGRDAALHSGVVDGISPDPSVHFKFRRRKALARPTTAPSSIGR